MSLLLLLAGLAGCGDFSFFTELGDSPFQLAIAPAAVTLETGGSIVFQASGGTPPYTFSASEGAIDPDTGLYTAPDVPGNYTVAVQDARQNSREAAVAVGDSGLAVFPSPITVALNQSVDLTASGGVGPYSYSLTANGSGSPGIDPATGLYTAGPLPGTDSVEVTDSGTLPRSGTVDIQVTDIVTNVDYNVSAVNAPPSGAGGMAIPAGFDFTILNGGSIGGTKTVEWRVFLSDDTALDEGDRILSSGSTGALAPLATATVPISGTWPAAAGTWYLLAALAAVDDLSPANNVTASGAVAVSAADVRYSVGNVTCADGPGGSVAGEPLAGTFDLQNQGAAGGACTVYWTAYVSADAVWDAGDTIVDSGSSGALAAGVTNPGISFGGTWPSTAGTFFLLVRADASDDVAPSDNTGASGAVTVDPRQVDYTVSQVSYLGGTPMPGREVNGNFRYQNAGTHHGTLTVSWTAYASRDASLDASDAFVASGGGLSALAAGTSSGLIPFAGAWPAAFGDYYLLVRLWAGEDVDTLNNTGATGAPTAVGCFAESEENGDCTNLVGVDVLGVTLRPGMSVRIAGTMPAGDSDDVFHFNTGTAARVTLAIGWDGASADCSFRVYTAPGTFILPGYGISGTNGFSYTWTVDSPNTDRWIDFHKPEPPSLDLGNYLFYITATD